MAKVHKRITTKKLKMLIKTQPYSPHLEDRKKILEFEERNKNGKNL